MNTSLIFTKLLLQEDILFLYKAMEALVASNHAVTPVIPAAATTAASASQPLPPDQTSPVAIAAPGTKSKLSLL